MRGAPVELVFDVVGKKAILREESNKKKGNVFYLSMASLWVTLVYINYELWGLFR